MKVTQKQPHDTNEIRIRGLVVPASWAGDGEVLSVVISAFDETEYQVADNELARQLFGKLHQLVKIDGELIETQGGKKMIKVQSFKVEKGAGAGKTLLTLAVAAAFGLVCLSPALAAESKAPAPAAKQMEAAKPAAKAMAPAKAAPAKKEMKAKKKSAKKTAKKKTVKPSPTVKKAQMALAQAGFKTKADGYMGKNTAKAIKGYQKKNGLKVNGKLDKSTKKALGL
jgi:hypothetical protein